VIRRYKFIFIISLWSFLHIYPVYSCQYNVREVGFSDLGREQYYLFGYIKSETGADISASFSNVAPDHLKDSNIIFELINIDDQKDHPAIHYLDSLQINSFPSAILVSPDGQSMALPLIKTDVGFKQSLRSSLNELLISPKRDEILQKTIKHYAVVLLIEGNNKEENSKANEAAIAAIERLSKKMNMMPKPIDHPPVLMVIKRESFAREKILLWSLGLDIDNIDKPHAAVIYGRARWMGPLFKNEEITKNNLSDILFVVGADCECGIDKNWILGTMLPIRWNKEWQDRLVKNLGFDPENPLIKMEIGRIMRTGYYNSALLNKNQKAEADTGSAPGNEQADHTKSSNVTSSASRGDPGTEESVTNVNESPLQTSIIVTICLLVLILGIGLTMFYRKMRKQS
jgi:hypothetical protein